MTETEDGFTEPTTDYWQRILDRAEVEHRLSPPYRYRYPARLPDGRYLDLPIRRLRHEPQFAVASFIANHASFQVVRALTGFMVELARALAPDVVVGLPTLGLTFAPGVAEGLGLVQYAPFGYSRKFWYDDALSVPSRSITTPGGGKNLYVDPNVVPRISGKRVVIVDDAVSTGQTLVAAMALCRLAGAEPAAAVVAMVQTERWRHALEHHAPGWPGDVRGVFESHRFALTDAGWVIAP